MSMKRKRPAAADTPSGARWLEPAAPHDLLASVSQPPWAGETVEDITHSAHEAEWERQPHNSESFFHDILWCRRTGAMAFAIHRFTTRPGSTATPPLTELRSLARAEAADGYGDTGTDSASNIGGFHGARELWWRPEVMESSLPNFIGCAIRSAAQAEAAGIGRSVLTAGPDEAWVNVLGTGAWNCLHTHPGSTYSGVFYVDDGNGSSQPRSARKERGLASRLCFVYNRPLGDLPDYHRAHLRGPSAAALARVEEDEAPHFLLIDPTPGTCVVFPSFVPHCVLPAQLGPEAAPPPAGAAGEGVKSDSAPLRLSIAFNFGASDPVLAQALVLPCWGGGTARVKLILETTPIWGIAAEE